MPFVRPGAARAEAGGNAFHTGGRQFATKQDPQWRTLARWVGGPTAK
jgi:hypothetical protein